MNLSWKYTRPDIGEGGGGWDAQVREEYSVSEKQTMMMVVVVIMIRAERQSSFLVGGGGVDEKIWDASLPNYYKQMQWEAA